MEKVFKVAGDEHYGNDYLKGLNNCLNKNQKSFSLYIYRRIVYFKWGWLASFCCEKVLCFLYKLLYYLYFSTVELDMKEESELASASMLMSWVWARQ